MPRLGRSAESMAIEYDAVVVGSGYGGGVAASRLARIGLKVAVLERGREHLPGAFPTTVLGAQRELQLNAGRHRIGRETALFDVALGNDVHVLSGCGLGGTSLINANVCLFPDTSILQDDAWPEQMRLDHRLFAGFSRAQAMLAPQTLPARIDVKKLSAFREAAEKCGHQVGRVPLHIAFEKGTSIAGVEQEACTLCGDCMGGCNVGAKTTVHNTYLADAVRHGAELFVETRARYVTRLGDGTWRVYYERLDKAAEVVKLRAVKADVVVLAAGTLGSTEILLRSRERGLALSDRLGERFSMNADAIAFGYNNDRPVNAIGVGHPPRARTAPVGPGVTGMIDLRGRKSGERLVIVEAAMQSAMASLLPILLAAGSATGTDLDTGLKDAMEETGRKAKSLLKGAYSGAVQNTQVFLAVGHDGAHGRLELESDRIKIVWPDAAKAPVFGAIEEELKKLVAATGGTYVPNPATSILAGSNLMTVHPLGGCCIGTSRDNGVVNHKCQVFDGATETAPDEVLEGLYVCDGAVVPRSLGVHPLLTITAIAERAMMILAADYDLELTVPEKSPLNGEAKSPASPPSPHAGGGLRRWLGLPAST